MNATEAMKEKHLELLERYIRSWLTRDIVMFLGTLGENIDIRECYGASYSSRSEAEKWFRVWNERGKVTSWVINDSYFDSDRGVLIATWEFCHEYPGVDVPRFDGVTLLSVEGERIVTLHEYETKHERYYPYR